MKYFPLKSVVVPTFAPLKTTFTNGRGSLVFSSKTTPFIVHFRIGTHGTSNGIYNVHPFYVDKNLVFAHNGMIHKVDDCKKRSDTRVFNDTFLKPLGSKL